MIKVIHIISGLNAGGAEKMLYKLLTHTDKQKYRHEVISMTDKSVYGPLIENLGIKVHCLEMKRGIPSLKSILKARKIVKNAEVIQTWMYHADLLGFIIYKITACKKIIWGIRRSNLDRDKNKLLTLLIVKINSLLSSKVDYIVSCSIEAKKVHIRAGYSKENFIVIPNGFEINTIAGTSELKLKIQNELELNPKDRIIINIARWEKLKDHNNLFSALQSVKLQKKNVKLLLCGLDMESENHELISLINKYELNETILLLGVRNDIPSLLAATEMLVSSSSDEGFPNVIGEAMVSKRPCVVTDVGDSAYIVGDYGIVVSKQNSMRLAEGMLEMLNKSVEQMKYLGDCSRDRIVNNFDIKDITKRFEKLYN